MYLKTEQDALFFGAGFRGIPVSLFVLPDDGEFFGDDVSGLVQGVRFYDEHLVVLAQQQARPTDVDGRFLEEEITGLIKICFKDCG